MLKMLFVATLLVFSSAQASSIQSVEVLKASFNSKDQMIEVSVSHEGCGDAYNLKVKSCTDFIIPHAKCAAVVEVLADQSCETKSVNSIQFARENVTYNNESLSSKNFNNTILIIRGLNKSTKEIQLR